MTNREVVNQMSDGQLARWLVKLGLKCQHCPARQFCTGSNWIPCEQRLKLWLEAGYVKEESRNGLQDQACMAEK